jgi:very-short-patch-repair endonuclease
MAAVLAAGPGAALSPGSAAAHLGIGHELRLEISVPATSRHRPPGVTIHRRARFEAAPHRGIPTTTPACTLVDLAPRLPRSELERAINQADNQDLIDPESLRAAVGKLPNRPGKARLERVLDIRTFALTDSELERLFIPIALRAGLPKPLTREYVNDFRVDFFWPDLKLIVETDSLRYHRTPAEQHRDRLRDQIHTAAGFTPLRFTHGQVKHHLRVILYRSSIVSASSPTSRKVV